MTQYFLKYHDLNNASRFAWMKFLYLYIPNLSILAPVHFTYQGSRNCKVHPHTRPSTPYPRLLHGFIIISQPHMDTRVYRAEALTKLHEKHAVYQQRSQHAGPNIPKPFANRAAVVAKYLTFTSPWTRAQNLRPPFHSIPASSSSLYHSGSLSLPASPLSPKSPFSTVSTPDATALHLPSSLGILFSTRYPRLSRTVVCTDRSSAASSTTPTTAGATTFPGLALVA